MSQTNPQFMFDFGSPNAFLSHEAIPAIEKRTGAKFEYVPILLGGIFKATNNKSPAETLAGVKNKREFHALETERFIRRFKVNGKKLSGGEVFAESTSGLFDGFRIDTKHRIWTSTAEGVHCIDSDGTLIGKIRIPEMVANVTFGGTKWNRLFICGTTSLYSIYLTAKGSKLG